MSIVLKSKLVKLFLDRERRQRPSRRVPLMEHSGIELLDRRLRTLKPRV
jgi:hypothetical protein